MRVVLADDHPMFRFGLTAALTDVAGIDLLEQASDAAELLSAVRRLRPQVALTDLSMPGPGGPAMIGALRAAAPATAVLVLTMHDDDDSVLAALRAGAAGYLLKGAERDEIVRAILTVADGGAVYGGRVARRVAELLAAGPADPADSAARAFPGLTPREESVLTLVAQGLGNHEIARRLGLSEKTVRNNLATVLAKLHLRDRAAAVAHARDAGLGAGPR
ncbi:response regulator transcription factor [Occultella glacieicola]|uniref:Response regulator transcription factor n=1 Tax=Occultella glacieicola TaxID=2518684 RepID=A0ABY2E8T7_9MICO|nr:response regulator transcription factor [Occultella glacieicola]